MKKLIIILLALVAYGARAQIAPITQYLGAPNTRVEIRGQSQTDSMAYFGFFPDTNRIPGRAAAWFFNTTDKYFYMHDGLKWNRMAIGTDVLAPGTGLQQVGNTIGIAPSGVTAGVYNIPTYQVNLQGQLIKSGSANINTVGSGTASFFTSTHTVGALTILDLNTRKFHDTTYISWHIGGDGNIFALLDTAGLHSAIGGGGGGAGVWGSITGTLSAQTDLQTALNGKLGTALNNGNLFVGNGSNVAVGVTPTGDWTISNTGVTLIGSNAITTTKINANAVTYSKIQQVNAARLLGNPSGVAANASEISLGYGSLFVGSALTVDTTTIATKAYIANLPIDSVKIIHDGAPSGFQIGRGNGTDSLHLYNIIAGTGMNIVHNADSSLTFNSTAIGGDTALVRRATNIINPDTTFYLNEATVKDTTLSLPDRYTYRNNTIVPIDTTNGLWRADAGSSIMTSDGYLILLFSNFFTTFTGDGNQCRIGAVRSFDRGKTYSAPYTAFPQTFHFGSYIPSMWEVNPNDIRAFILGRDGTGSNIYITNMYIIKSTDHGLTWSLIDSLYNPRPNFYVASAADRVKTDPQNKAIKYFAFEYNTGTSNPLSLTANYHGKIAKSTDTGKTWTVLPIELLSPDSATNEPGIIFPQKNFNQSGFDISQKMLYYWRTESLGNIWANDSYDNGTTFQGAYNTGIGAPGSTSTMLTVNSKQYILAVHNLYPSPTFGRSGQPWSRQYMMLSASPDNGRTWQDLATLWGPEITWHYFEPWLLYDSVNQNLIVYVSRMDSLQHLSSIESKVVDIGRALSSSHLLENMATLNLLANADVMTNKQDGILTIGNLNLGTTAGFLKFGSSGGSIGTYDPQISAKSNTDIAAGIIFRSQMGQDANVAYYSAGYAFDALSPSNGTLSTGFIAKFSNNHVEKFTIGPTGMTFFNDTGSLAARFSYNSNLHGSFTQYSLVDKKYVDSLTAGGSGGGGTIFKGWDSMLIAQIAQTANRIQSLGNHDLTFTNLTSNGITFKGASPKLAMSDTTTSNATFNISDNGGGIFFNSGSGIVAYILDKSTRFQPASPDNNYPLNSGDYILTTTSSLVDHFKLSVTSTATASANSSMRNTGSFAPTSGSASYNFWLLDATINQTGGASGITHGIYLNPTVTAAADYRAIETSTGKIIFNGIKNAPSGGLPIYVKGTDSVTYEIAQSSLTGIPNIYNADGTLSGNRTVTGASNILTFTGLTGIKFNSTVIDFAKSDGTFPYEERVGSTAANLFTLGFIKTGSYVPSFGIDTNTNVFAGTSAISTSAPLYTTGGGFFATTGFTSASGNYFSVKTVSNGTTSIDGTYYFIRCDATSGNVIINLPAVSSVFGGGVGIKYIFKRMDATGNTITINRAGSDLIDGSTSITLTTQYQSKTIMATATNEWSQQ